MAAAWTPPGGDSSVGFPRWCMRIRCGVGSSSSSKRLIGALRAADAVLQASAKGTHPPLNSAHWCDHVLVSWRRLFLGRRRRWLGAW